MSTARTGARTLDIVVKSHTLYRLSYPGLQLSHPFDSSRLLMEVFHHQNESCFFRSSLTEVEFEKSVASARIGARTLDIVVKSHTLYQLSYPGAVQDRLGSDCLS